MADPTPQPSAPIAERKVPIPTRGFVTAPQTFEDLYRFATLVARSGMVPKEYVDNPGAVIVAIQHGGEIGLAPMQAVQNIAVINGRPYLWGEGFLAIVRTHPEFHDIDEVQTDAEALCRVSRRGRDGRVKVIERAFSLEDAKNAGLLDKPGPWKQYRKRMLQMRARRLACADLFPDALKGIGMAEEAIDEPINVTPVDSKPEPSLQERVAAAAEEAKDRVRPTATAESLSDPSTQKADGPASSETPSLTEQMHAADLKTADDAALRAKTELVNQGLFSQDPAPKPHRRRQ